MHNRTGFVKPAPSVVSKLYSHTAAKLYRYEGEVVDGLRHGVGKLFIGEDGDYYEGEFVKGEIQGSGTRRWSDGRVARGTWLAGELHGFGQMLDPRRGVQYEGDFLGNAMHGQGILRVRDGIAGSVKTITGSFAQGRAEGECSMECVDERTGDTLWTYAGHMRAGLEHGEGTCTHVQGGWRYSGMWEAGQRSGRGVWSALPPPHAPVPVPVPVPEPESYDSVEGGQTEQETLSYDGEWDHGLPSLVPARVVLSVGPWSLPPAWMNTWPPPPSPAPGSEGSASARPGSSAGGKKAPAAAAAKGAGKQSDPLPAAPPAPPLYRQGALLCALGLPSVPTVTLTVLWEDAHRKEQELAAQAEKAAAEAAAAEAERLRLEAEAAAAAAAAKGKKGAAPAKAAAVPPVAVQPSTEAATATAQPSTAEIRPDPPIAVWEAPLSCESGRLWRVYLVRRETSLVTQFSAHVTQAKEAYAAAVQKAAAEAAEAEAKAKADAAAKGGKPAPAKSAAKAGAGVGTLAPPPFAYPPAPADLPASHVPEDCSPGALAAVAVACTAVRTVCGVAHISVALPSSPALTPGQYTLVLVNGMTTQSTPYGDGGEVRAAALGRGLPVQAVPLDILPAEAWPAMADGSSSA